MEQTTYAVTLNLSLNEAVVVLDGRTSTAYSYRRYSRGGWRQAIRALLLEGFSSVQIEWIMFSKLTRWAADQDNARYGRVSGAALMRYLEKNDITPASTLES